MKLELWYPVNNKPFSINQAWGNPNPAYSRFGFTKHNGIDLPFPDDDLVYSPIKGKVVNIGYYPEGSGRFVEILSDDVYEINAKTCKILTIFMHNEQILVNLTENVDVGTPLAVPDNTGFSTGPHIHMGCYRVSSDGLVFLDKNDANGSFNPMPYFNGFYAADYKPVIENLEEQVSLAQKVVNFLKRLLNLNG